VDRRPRPGKGALQRRAAPNKWLVGVVDLTQREQVERDQAGWGLLGE
jgi:hypothetical protein